MQKYLFNLFLIFEDTRNHTISKKMKNPFNKKEQESLFSGIQNELYSEREIITSFTENNVAPLMSEPKPDPTQFLSTSSKIKHQK